MLQGIKQFLRDQLGLPPSAVLVITGAILHLALNFLLRKPATSPWGLLAPLLAGLGLEAYEIWVQYRQMGLFAAGNDPLVVILARHGLDVLRILAVPAVLVAYGALAAR